MRARDMVAARLVGLPSPGAYRITRDLRVPMRDGVELLADHYAPEGPSRGTVLVRSPYGRGVVANYLSSLALATQGYRVLLQSCRGTFGSGGNFDPMGREIDDAADTIAWLREQAWFEGSFATVGGSYFGFTQWALMVDPPPELAAAVILCAPHDIHEAVHDHGGIRAETWLTWFEGIDRQEEFGMLRAVVRSATALRRLAPVFDGLPLLDAVRHHMPGAVADSHLEAWLTRPDPTDDYWTNRRLHRALERTRVPVLLVGGWQDIFLGQTLAQYTALRRRGVDAALTVGPWTHAEAGTKGAKILLGETLDWLGEHLDQPGTPRRRDARVRVYVTGAGTWRALEEWPFAPVEDATWHLHPDGQLATEPAPAEAPSSRFTYDPAYPTPSVGGQLLSVQGGYRDNQTRETRDDVLTFTSLALQHAVEVIGTPVVHLAHTSDTPHADLFVRLCDVDPKGRSTNVADGFVRLDPSSVDGTVHLELDAIAHRFQPESRIRLQVSGGAHPQFLRNLGTGEDTVHSSRTEPSSRTISHGAGGASRLTLPIAHRGGHR